LRLESSTTKNICLFFCREKLSEIKWIYPIRGVAAIYPIKNKSPLLLECMVRSRLEKRLEIFLSDIDSSSNIDRATKVRSVTPQDARPRVPDGAIVGDGKLKFCFFVLLSQTLFFFKGRHIEREFLYTVIFKNNSLEYTDVFRNSLGIKLVRYHRDRISGLITLIFDAVFCPPKSFVLV
jgi:hypothetical protein